MNKGLWLAGLGLLFLAFGGWFELLDRNMVLPDREKEPDRWAHWHGQRKITRLFIPGGLIFWR
jgi:hypothetical protein